MAALPNAVRGAGRFQWHCFAGKIGSEKAAMQSPCLVVRLLIMLVWNETADRVGVISFWNREPTRHLREDRRRTNLESIGHYTIITMFRSSELHSGQYIRHTFKECTHGIHIVIRPYIFR